MQYWKSFIDSYMTFHYGVGFAIGLVIFGGYLFVMSKCKKSQGQSISKKEVLCGLALSVYLVFLLGGTLLNRSIGEEYLIELIPFWSYYQIFTLQDKPLAWQILYNVLVFIPWGILLPEIFKVMRGLRFVAASAAGVSFVIEVVQFVFKLGLFEFDDIFHNTLGAVIGFVMWRVIRRRKTD